MLMNPQAINPDSINQLMDIVSRNQRNYTPIRIECNSIVAKDRNGAVVTWQKPSWGRMILDHDGYRTVVERYNSFNFRVNTYINYDLISVETY